MKRSRLLLCALTSICLSAVAASALGEDQTSQWVHPSPDGKLEYKSTPTGDRIMDFSYAGYMGGGVALPTVGVVRSVAPSGSNDDTATIQAAIDEASALPLKDGFRGAVLLKPGTYRLSKTINVSA